MESKSIKTGKTFHGAFAATAVRLGLATPIEESEGSEPKVQKPVQKAKKGSAKKK